MNKRNMFALTIVMAALLVTLVTPAAADPMQNPPIPDHHFDPETNELLINAGVMGLRLDGDEPIFRVKYNPTDDPTMYEIAYTNLTEFSDLNGDGAFELNETVNVIPFSAIDWQLSIVNLTDDLGNYIGIKFTYTKVGVNFADLSVTYTHDELNALTIQLVSYIYVDTNHTIEISTHHGEVNYTVNPITEVKTDIVIGNYPFSDQDNMVTIGVHLSVITPNAYRHVYRLRHNNMYQYINSTNVSDNATREQVLQRMQNETMAEIGFPSESDLDPALFRWLEYAVVNNNGVETTVNVSTSYLADSTGVQVYLAYPNFNGTLVHDPSIVLNEEAFASTSLPDILIIGGIIAVIAVAAVLVKKH